LGARLATEIYKLELVAQISVHDRRIQAIMFAAGAAAVLIEPFFQTMVVEDLLAIVALHILFLDYVEADGAEEGVHELLVRLHSVLLG